MTGVGMFSMKVSIEKDGRVVAQKGAECFSQLLLDVEVIVEMNCVVAKACRGGSSRLMMKGNEACQNGRGMTWLGGRQR